MTYYYFDCHFKETWNTEKTKLLARIKQLEIERKQAEERCNDLLVSASLLTWSGGRHSALAPGFPEFEYWLYSVDVKSWAKTSINIVASVFSLFCKMGRELRGIFSGISPASLKCSSHRGIKRHSGWKSIVGKILKCV